MLLGRQETLTNLKNSENEMNEWVETLLGYKKIEKLDRETVAEILDKVVVTTADDTMKVQIVFRFNL